MKFCNAVIPLLLFVAIGIDIYDFGFKPFWSNSDEINQWQQIIIDLLVVFTGLRLVVVIGWWLGVLNGDLFQHVAKIADAGAIPGE